jgi:hypothetical protein
MKKITALFLLSIALFAHQAIAQQKSKSTPAPKAKTSVVKKSSTAKPLVVNKEIVEMKAEKGCCKMSNCKKRIGEMIALTDDQKAMMKKIKNDTKEKIQELTKDQSITLKEYNDKKTQILREAKVKREEVLTGEQKEKIAAIKKENQSKNEQAFSKRINKLKIDLQLKDEQVNQLNDMHQKNREKMVEIKNNSQLNDQEKKVQMRELRMQAQEMRMKILTEEQGIKLEAMKGKKSKLPESKTNEVRVNSEESIRLN